MVLLREETIGDSSENVCRLFFQTPETSVQRQYRIVRASLPRMPFYYTEGSEVTVGNEVISLQENASSLAHLCTLLTALRTSGGGKVMTAYFNSNELEICAEAADVTLSEALSDFLQVDLVLLADQCYDSTLDESLLSQSDHYRVVVEGQDVQGFYIQNAYTQIVDEFQYEKNAPQTVWTTKTNTDTFSLLVQVVRTNGDVVNLPLGTTERFVLWVLID